MKTHRPEKSVMSEVGKIESSKSTFTIDWIPPSLNQQLRSHWSFRMKMKDALALHLVAAGARKRGMNLVTDYKVRVTIQMYRSRQMDDDNRMGACKCIFDALRRLGYAVDDSPEWMEMRVPPVIVDTKHHRSIITIERLTENDARGRL